MSRVEKCVVDNQEYNVMTQPANMGVVILAAGRGSRLGCTDIPKVMMTIGGKPIVDYTVETLEKLGFGPERIILVVGFQKEKVKAYFGSRVTYAYQEKQVGTAHAAFVGMDRLPDGIEKVLVMGGDDSAFYTPETLNEVITYCGRRDPDICVVTSQQTNPGLGRVIRDQKTGHVIAIREKEQLSQEEILANNEINTGTYVIRRHWFMEMFPHMPIIKGLGEYGLNTAIEVALNEGKSIRAYALPNNDEWFGINTIEQLQEAERRKAV